MVQKWIDSIRPELRSYFDSIDTAEPVRYRPGGVIIIGSEEDKINIAFNKSDRPHSRVEYEKFKKEWLARRQN